jgi:hypothetical protein
VTLSVRPCGITVARVGVARVHRHHRPPLSALVAFEALVDGWPIGWATVGRPVSRVLQARGWVEVTRVATDGTRNACSLLYGAAARWARKNGTPICTYTFASESGASLRGAGWVVTGRVPGRRWSRPSRARQASQTEAEDKLRWSPPWCASVALAEAA